MYSITFNKILSGNRKDGYYESKQIFEIPIPGRKKALNED
jgi:hypothetical protein